MDMKQIKQGIIDAIPIVFGYLPIGIAFGVIAQSEGIGPLGVFLISSILFAGSAQFVLISLLSELISGVSIVLSIFVVNIRHLLMSSSYAKYLKDEPIPSILFLSFFITDESFAIGIVKAKQENRLNATYLKALELTGYVSWVLFTVMGSLIGNRIVNLTDFGIDFALQGMFIGLLFLMIKTQKDAFLSLLAGIISLLLYLTPLRDFSVIVGAIVASILMVRWSK
jgi:4-azaleucine resistance transporter AzlC